MDLCVGNYRPVYNRMVHVHSTLEVYFMSLGIKSMLDVIRAEETSAKERGVLCDGLEVLIRALMDPGLEAYPAAYLTPVQQRLYSYLKLKQGRVVRKSTMMEALYFNRPDTDWPKEKILDVYVCHLNKRLKGERIVNVHSVGWRLEKENDSADT